MFYELTGDQIQRTIVVCFDTLSNTMSLSSVAHQDHVAAEIAEMKITDANKMSNELVKTAEVTAE